LNQKTTRIFACGVLFGLAFVLTSPFILLDATEASKDIRYEMRHYSTGHLGQTGNSFVSYTRYLWNDHPLYLLLGVPGLAIMLWHKKRIAVPTVAFVAIYFGLIGIQTVHMGRNALPVMVLLMAAAGIAVDVLSDRLPSKLRDWRLGLRGLGLSPMAIGIMGVVLWPSLVRALLRSAHPSGQAKAQAWFNRALERSAGQSQRSLPNIAAEGYTIYLDPQQHRITYLTSAADVGTVDDFVAQGYDIVLLGSGMYGRFYANPSIFADRVAAYGTFFKGSLDRLSFDPPRDPLSFVGGGGKVHAFFLTERAKAFKADAEKLTALSVP
jgi:hypothetical protein